MFWRHTTIKDIFKLNNGNVKNGSKKNTGSRWSGRGQGSDVVNGFEKGADEYIVKPFRPSDLIACIKKILNKK